MTMYIYAIANPENMPKAEIAIREELEKLLADGITPDELTAARAGYLQNQIVDRADDAQLASTLNKQVQAGRSMGYYSELEQRLNALTPDDVLAALKKHVDLDHIAIVVAGDFGRKPPDPAGE